MIRRRLERPRITRDARPRRNDLQGTKVDRKGLRGKSKTEEGPDTDGKIFILAEIFRFKATRIPVKAPRLQWALRRQADCEVEWVGAREREEIQYNLNFITAFFLLLPSIRIFHRHTSLYGYESAGVLWSDGGLD